ncbi:hypothetical protein [Celeribacter halophilus]|uniref:hypothetical protein n=1 Tax=Celeribacter halophilus TaxID=576117 RepID=UPI003A92F359
MIFDIRKNFVTLLAMAFFLVAFGLGCWAFVLRDRLDIAEDKIGGFEDAARIRRQSDREQARLREEAAQLDDYLDAKEGGDAPLSDYLSDAAGRLWP